MKPPLRWRIARAIQAWWESRGDREGTYVQQIQVLKSEPRIRRVPLNLRVMRSHREVA